MKENALVLGRCLLKCLRVKSHDTCYTFSVGLSKGDCTWKWSFSITALLTFGPGQFLSEELSVHHRMSSCPWPPPVDAVTHSPACEDKSCFLTSSNALLQGGGDHIGSTSASQNQGDVASGQEHVNQASTSQFQRHCFSVNSISANQNQDPTKLRTSAMKEDKEDGGKC